MSIYLNIDFLLGDYLFGAVKLTKNRYDPEPDKYEYWYSIEFNPVHNIHCQIFDAVQIFVILGIDISSSMHADNRKKGMLVLGESLTDELMKVMCQEKLNNILILPYQKILHYNRSNDFLYDNGVKNINLRQRIQNQNHVNSI